MRTDVHWSGRSHPGYLADASMAFADGTLHFAAPGYDGAVDVKQGWARLQLFSTVGGVLAPRRSSDDGARGRAVKRRALIRELTKAGCYLKRPGKKHDIYVNPRNGRKVPVCRHLPAFRSLHQPGV